MYTDTSKVTLRPIAKPIAKEMIETNHYSHQWRDCKFSLGIFYIGTEHDFFDTSEKLIGCMTWAWPVGRNVASGIVDGLTQQNTLELTRLWIEDGYGTNIESYCVGWAIRWIKRNHKHIKMLVSYSDPEHGHAGIIYQASNWLYQGSIDRPGNWVIKFSLDDPNEQWMHNRTYRQRYDSMSIEELALTLDRPFYFKDSSFKHRYLYPLGSKRERRQMIRELKRPILAYPKSLHYHPVVKCAEVVNGNVVITVVEETHE